MSQMQINKNAFHNTISMSQKSIKHHHHSGLSEKLNWFQSQLSNAVNLWNEDMATTTSENDIANGNQLFGLVENVEEVIKGIDTTGSTDPHVFWSQH